LQMYAFVIRRYFLWDLILLLHQDSNIPLRRF
jgi:hypothetical protein